MNFSTLRLVVKDINRDQTWVHSLILGMHSHSHSCLKKGMHSHSSFPVEKRNAFPFPFLEKKNDSFFHSFSILFFPKKVEKIDPKNWLNLEWVWIDLR